MGALIASSLLAYASVEAQGATKASEPEVIELSEMEVRGDGAGLAALGAVSNTGLLGNTSVLDTPFSLSRLGQDIIQGQRAFTSFEVLKNDPSVYVAFPGSRYGYYDTFGIRGFDTHNWYSYRVDGMAFANQGENPIENKEQLEILKGAAALRFGYAPPGGVINYVRKLPTAEPTVSVAVDVDTFGLLLGQVDAGGRAAEGAFGYRIVGAAESWASFQDGADDGHRYLGSAYFDYNIGDKLRVYWGGEYQDVKRAYISAIPISINGKVFDDLPREFNADAHDSRYFVETAALFGGLEFEATDAITLHSDISHNWFTRGAKGRGTNSTYQIDDDGSYDAYAYMYDDERRPAFNVQNYAEVEFETGGVEHDMVVGMSYRAIRAYWGDYLETYNDAQGNPVRTSIYNPVYIPYPVGTIPPTTLNQEVEEWGWFVTDSVQFDEQWSVLMGLRYGEVANGVGAGRLGASAVSPSVALRYKPQKNATIYTTFSEGLEAGGRAPKGTVNEDEIMGALRSKQAEAGFKWELPEGRGELTTAVFYITQPLEYTTGAGVYTQSGEKAVYGWELGKVYNWTPGFRTSAGFTLLNAEQKETGDPLADGKLPQSVATFQANVGVDYDLPIIEGLSVGSRLYYVGDRYADSYEGIEMDAYFRLDASVKYKWTMMDARWTARVNVENVLDEKYFAGGYYFGGFGGNIFYGAPVNARFSLAVDF